MNLTNTRRVDHGGKRIGLVVAEALAARGADVALTYARSRSEAEQAADRVRAAGRRALVVQADLSAARQRGRGCRSRSRHRSVASTS